ncbi:hypothetical protein JCM10207_002161 [Rhodosporidiobolus poonsookiae]
MSLVTLLALTATLYTASSVAAGDADPLPADTIKLLKNRLALNSTDVWVSGTRIEALLETDFPEVAVFEAPYVPYKPLPDWQVPAETNEIVYTWADQRSPDCTQFYCIDGGAAADPASLGVGWMIAAEKNASLLPAVDEEIDYLMQDVLRFDDEYGTMSMRQANEEVSCWADFVYMVPPFLAYYGVANHNETIIDECFRQLHGYRSHLLGTNTNLWKHITDEGAIDDPNLWATGNAWVAGGLLRVAATLRKSTYWAKYEKQVDEILGWADAIVAEAFTHIRDDDLLPNYFDYSPADTFSDGSASALLASVPFRLAGLGYNQTSTNLDIAERVRVAVNKSINETTGWIAPAVNPIGWGENSGESPESVAFALLLDAAYRAYVEA